MCIRDRNNSTDESGASTLSFTKKPDIIQMIIGIRIYKDILIFFVNRIFLTLYIDNIYVNNVQTLCFSLNFLNKSGFKGFLSFKTLDCFILNSLPSIA